MNFGKKVNDFCPKNKNKNPVFIGVPEGMGFGKIEFRPKNSIFIVVL